jgi:hypothetical protein
MTESVTNDLFLAGTARGDITPRDPIPMGGYGQRAGKLSEGVHDPLFVKVLVLQMGARRSIFITTDLLCIPDAIYRSVVESLVTNGIAKEEEICICASHTHSGPEMKDNLIVARNGDDFNNQVVTHVLEACREAVGALVPAKIKMAVGKADFLFNRRQRTANGLVDERVLAIQINEKVSRKGLAVLFGVGCHAVTLGHDNRLISADFPGVAQKYIEEHLDVNNALFINLTEGNVIPVTRGSWNSLDTRGYLGGTFADSEKIGTALGREVVACLKNVQAAPVVHLRPSRRSFTVRPTGHGISKLTAFRAMRTNRRIILEYLPEFKRANLFNLSPVFTLWRDASAKVIERNMSEIEMQRLMSAVSTFIVMLSKLLIAKFRKPVPVSVQTIEINDFRFMTLPGEVLVEVGKEWQERNHPNGNKAFIIGLANGWTGYLPHPSNFQEPDAEFKYETIMNALEPDATRIALDIAEQMVKEGD